MVPKLENSWPPKKRMENIVMKSDVTKLTEETFEMETMAAGPKPDVQYGLTVVTRVQEQTTTTQGIAVASPRRSSSFQEMEICLYEGGVSSSRNFLLRNSGKLC